MTHINLKEDFLRTILNLQNPDASNVKASLSSRCLCNWMSFLRDDSKLLDIIIPGSHNSTSYSMREKYYGIFPNLPDMYAKCQELNLISQLLCGVRYLDLRVTIKEGELIFCHGKVSGRGVEPILLEQLLLFNEVFPEEVVILDFQKFMVPAAVGRTVELLERVLNPEISALKAHEFPNAKMGLFRKQKYKYVILWGSEEITRNWQLSRGSSLRSPYKDKVAFSHAQRIIKYVEKHISKWNHDKLFCAQFIFRPIISSPLKIEERGGHHFSKWINSLDQNCKCNIIERDFIDRCFDNIGHMMRLNLEKGHIKKEGLTAFQLLAETFGCSKSESEKNCDKLSIYRPERACSQLELGVKGVQGYSQLQRQEVGQPHKASFLARLSQKICLKRNRNSRELISFKAPHGFVISYVTVIIEKIRKDLSFKFRVEKGWLLENEIDLRVVQGQLNGLNVVYYAEAVPLSEALFKFSDKFGKE